MWQNQPIREVAVSDDSSAVLALKNAWTGVVATSDEVRDLAPSVQALSDDTPLTDLDLERYHRAILAHAIAVMALRGLVEQLRHRREAAAAG
jgi:hypothetical protein